VASDFRSGRGGVTSDLSPASSRRACASTSPRFGLELCEGVGAAEHRARYLAPLGRTLAVFEIERIARARVG